MLLAKNITANKFSKLDYENLYVQPKLDGVRTIAFLQNNKVVLLSRNNKEFKHFEFLRRQLKKILIPEITFDGELYNHDMSFQDIIKIASINKLEPSKDEYKIHYCIFDCIIISNLPFNKRWNLINKLYKSAVLYGSAKIPIRITLVKTFKVDNEYDLMNCYYKFIKNKFEGIIIRTDYKIFKYKPKKDIECKIIGAESAKGRDKNSVIWICILNNKQFKVRPAASLTERKEMYKNRKKYIGKWLTVEYQDLTDDGIPRFPVGKGIRDYE